MNIKKYIRDLGVRAQGVKGELASASSKRKNKAITAIAESIESGLNSILRENKKDVSLAKREKLGNAMIDRLSVNKNTIRSIRYNDISNYKWTNNKCNFRNNYFVKTKI